MRVACRALCFVMVALLALVTLLPAIPAVDPLALRSAPRNSRGAALNAAGAPMPNASAELKPQRSSAPPAGSYEDELFLDVAAYASVQALFNAHTDSILELTINNPRLAPPLLG